MIAPLFSENDNCIAGVLVLNPVQKCDFGRVYSRTMLVEGNSYKSITDFMNYINRKVDVFEVFQCEIYLRYYLLCIAPEYRGRGKRKHLEISKHISVPGRFHRTHFRMCPRSLARPATSEILRRMSVGHTFGTVWAIPGMIL